MFWANKYLIIAVPATSNVSEKGETFSSFSVSNMQMTKQSRKARSSSDQRTSVLLQLRIESVYKGKV